MLKLTQFSRLICFLHLVSATCLLLFTLPLVGAADLAPQQECLIVGNGAPVSRKVLKQVSVNKFKIALDGAAHTLFTHYKPALRPDLILGDFDSIREGGVALKTLASDVFTDIPMEHTPSQDFTDLEKGIHYCINSPTQVPAIWIINALGFDRLDHTLANLNFLKKYYSPSRPIYLIAENQVLQFVKDSQVIFHGKTGDAVGAFGFPKAWVTSSGLQYPMERYEVELGVSLSSSNYMIADEAIIKVEGEAFLTYPL